MQLNSLSIVPIDVIDCLKTGSNLAPAEFDRATKAKATGSLFNVDALAASVLHPQHGLKV